MIGNEKGDKTMNKNWTMRLTSLALILCAILCIFSGITTWASEDKDSYTDLAEGVGTIREYWCDEITTDILVNRGTDIIVEKIIGICLDKEGNGQIVNCADPKYNYISYKSVEGRYVGAVILTLCIFQPCNEYEDDVVQRFDYILER